MSSEMTMNGEAATEARELCIAAARVTLPMKLLTSTVLQGCNVHHGSTVIRQEVDLGGLAGLRTDKAGPGFAQRFLERFFDLRRALPESGMTPSFVERLHSPAGVRFEEALFEAVLAVETAMALARHDLDPIGFAQVVPTESPRKVLLVWDCRVPKISRSAAAIGLMGCVELLPEKLHPRRKSGSEDFATAIAALEARARRGERSTTTAVLALAAKRRGLPCENLRGPYLRLGHGALQRLIYASVTEHTSLAASQLARNKHRTNRRLAQLHLPITQQSKVATIEEAMTAASTLGFPVVLKPLKQKQAAGVTVGLLNANDIPAAFARAQRAGHGVIVESFVRGHAHRLLVIGGRFMAALKTVPPAVTGDGVRTIAELIEDLNGDPLRNGVRLFKVPIDAELAHDLELTGHALGDVLERGTTVALRAAANVAIGGIHSDVTDSVHPDNQEMAIRAAAGIGLDVAGIDFVTEDISRSYKEIGGSIIEVNARPGLCMHTWPRHGRSRYVAAAVLDLVFPPRVTGRIPIAVVARGQGAMRVAHDLDAILQASGKTVGLVTRKHSFINGEAAEPGTSRERRAFRTQLRDQRVQALVGTVSLRRTLRRGLGLDTCDVAAIMSRTADQDTDRALRGLEVVVRATRGMLVVGADDEAALKVLSAIDPKRLILVASSRQDRPIGAHVAAGAVVVSNIRERGEDWIVVYRKDKVIACVPATTGGRRRFRARRIESRKYAVALAFGLGLSGGDIDAALRSQRPRRRRATSHEALQE